MHPEDEPIKCWVIVQAIVTSCMGLILVFVSISIHPRVPEGVCWFGAITGLLMACFPLGIKSDKEL